MTYNQSGQAFQTTAEVTEKQNKHAAAHMKICWYLWYKHLFQDKIKNVFIYSVIFWS